MKFPTFKNELECLANGHAFAAGCDEVGVAPVAGPVVAAAVIIDPRSVQGYRSKSKWFYRVRDSKTTYEDERPELAAEIKAHCLAFGIGEVSPAEIDRINIHNASLLAMKNAVQAMLRNLKNSEQHRIFLFLDGRFVIKDLNQENISQKAVIDGDAKILSISAASIIAKVYRDALLQDMDLKYPQYGFGKHKGYSTRQHRLAIAQHGPTDYHRKSFLTNFNFQTI